MFRGSSAGYCSRSIVAKALHPELGEMDPAKLPFLDAGHYLQEQVEDFLMEVLPSHFSLLKEWRESEGEHLCDGFKIVGHVDGVLLDRTGVAKNKNLTGHYYLLEVKAIKEKSYKKLQKAMDWREVYPSYQWQAQTYLHFPRLVKSPELALGKDFKGTHFVYYNRNTSEMMTSLPVKHPAVEIRDDLYEPKDAQWYDRIIEKFSLCNEAIELETVPERCDATGYCFFCGGTGTGFTHVPKRRVVSLEGCDQEHTMIEIELEKMEESRLAMLDYFKEFNADEIELGDIDVRVRKEDYV